MPHPDRWEEYSNINTVVEGTRIICFKVPLKLALQSKIEDKDKFTPQSLIEQLNEDGKQLGLVIDLTFTTKYYDQGVFTRNNIKYEKIFTKGKEIPEDEVYMSFAMAIDTFLKENSDNDKLIGVHCTHGLNRTGYMVCRYMIEKLNVQPSVAIREFNKARGHPMERENYLDDLRERVVGEVTQCTPYNGAGQYNTIRVKQSESTRRYERREKSRLKREQSNRPYLDDQDDDDDYHGNKRWNSHNRDRSLDNDQWSPPRREQWPSRSNGWRAQPNDRRLDFHGNDRRVSHRNDGWGSHGNDGQSNPRRGGWDSGSHSNAGWDSGSRSNTGNTGWDSGSRNNTGNTGWDSGSRNNTGNTGWNSGFRNNTGWDAGSFNNAGWSSGSCNNAGGSSGSHNNAGWNSGSINNTRWSAGSFNNTGWSSGSRNNAGGSSGSRNNTGWGAGSFNNTGWSSGSRNNAEGDSGSHNNAGGDSGSHNNAGWGPSTRNNEGWASQGNSSWNTQGNDTGGACSNDGPSSSGNGGWRSHGNNQCGSSENDFRSTQSNSFQNSGNQSESWQHNSTSTVEYNTESFNVCQTTNQWGGPSYQDNSAWGHQSNNPMGYQNNQEDTQSASHIGDRSNPIAIP